MLMVWLLGVGLRFVRPWWPRVPSQLSRRLLSPRPPLELVCYNRVQVSLRGEFAGVPLVHG